jgi:hypothetical protein
MREEDSNAGSYRPDDLHRGTPKAPGLPDSVRKGHSKCNDEDLTAFRFCWARAPGLLHRAIPFASAASVSRVLWLSPLVVMLGGLLEPEAAAQTVSFAFGAKTDFVTGSFPYSVAVGDFNGDGTLDLATANFRSNTVSILLNTGPIGFSLGFDSPTVTAQQGTKIRVTVNINRIGGFTGSVTVTPPDPTMGITPNRLLRLRQQRLA